MELWEYVWGSKEDTVSVLVLDGCFGPNDRLRNALIEYRFLEPVDDRFRVRGAEDWLFRADAASKAGKASAATGKSLENLNRGTSTRSEKKTDSPNSSRTTPERTPERKDEKGPISPNPTQQPSTQHLSLSCQEKSEDPRPAQMVAAWNEAASGNVPRVHDSPSRREKCAHWLKDKSLSEWVAFVQRINASPFMRGEKGTFRVTFDWAMKPANLIKILEGNYDDHGPPTTTPPVTDANRCNATGCESAATHPFVMGDVSGNFCESHFYETWNRARAAS